MLLVDAYPHGFFGAQQTMYELAMSSAIEPVVFLVAEGPVADRFRAAGVPVIICEYPARLDAYGGAHSRAGAFAHAVSAVVLLGYNLRAALAIRRSKANVVFCSNTRSVLSVGFGARLLRRKVVWYVQQVEQSFGRADRVAGALSHRVATISDRLDRIFPPGTPARLRRKLISIPLGTTIVDMPDRPRGPRTGPVVLAVVGRISDQKGLHVLLDAFALARARHDIRLLVVGGPATDAEERYLQALQRQASEAGITDSISWLGFRDDVPAVLAGVDVLVSASLQEGVPRSIMEAMVAGVPVVATDIGAVADLVIDGDTGVLVPPGDAAALAAGLGRVVSDHAERERLALAARQHVVRSFDQRSFFAGFDALFHEVAR